LDDPDPAYQRPGLLDVGREASPTPAPEVVDGLPQLGSRAAVFFVRSAQLAPFGRALETTPRLRDPVRPLIVVTGPVPPDVVVQDARVVGGWPTAWTLVRPADPFVADLRLDNEIYFGVRILPLSKYIQRPKERAMTSMPADRPQTIQVKGMT